MAPKKMAGMPLEDESDNESAFYEAENRNVALTTASFELRRRQVKEFKVFPEKDEKNHVKQWRKWCRDALAELQKLKAYGGGSLANFAAQKLHLEKEKQASKTAWEQSDEWAAPGVNVCAPGGARLPMDLGTRAPLHFAAE